VYVMGKLAEMGVKTMDKLPEDKRAEFIDALADAVAAAPPKQEEG